ncbi:phosphotransferase family protein [Pseudonocardia spirodelae]|uniref:Aminoglycoside phosphotransferase family protein n=1 Tax=Pseudonocardia spirodelae TaxID=3133431 RepID=A0ABU8T8Y5_9PSEU
MDRTRPGVAAAVAVARAHGLTVTAAEVLDDGPVLVVRLHPAPVLAHVPQRLSAAPPAVRTQLTREVELVGALHRAGAPVVPPSPELPPGPHLRDGHWVSFWTDVPVDGSWEPTTADASAALAELATALTCQGPDLPLLGPARHDVPRGLAGLSGVAHLLGDGDADAVREQAAGLLEFAAAPGVATVPLHGDPHPARLVPAAGRLLWTGFGDACSGPAEWDLVPLHWLDRWSGTDVVAAHHRPDPDVLRRCSRLKALHLIAEAVLAPGTYDEAPGHGAHLRTMVDVLLERR